MANINLTWNGATDDNGISGYQIQWRLSTNSPWSTPPIFVNHNPTYGINTVKTGGGSYSHTPTQYIDHYFRIRIVDSVGQYSPYKEIFVSVSSDSVLISATCSTDSSIICLSHPFNPVNPIILLDTNNNSATQVAINYIVRKTDNTTFNGFNRYWRILLLDGSSWNCRVSTLGLVSEVIPCEISTIKSELISDGYSTNVSSTTNLLCEASLYYPIYYDGILTIGTIIYKVLNGNTLSSPFIGANKYYLISEDINTYFVKIGNNGSVSSIQDYLVVCPTNNSSNFCCFVEGTKISMYDKSIKLIEDIKVGDRVITYNEELKIQELGEVKKVISPLRSDIIEYKLSNGTIIKSTSCHPYFVVDKGWSSFNPELTKKIYEFEVSKIEFNDILLDIDNNKVLIIEINELITKEVKTYNLELSGNHTYYANGILVHNKYVVSNEPTRYDEFGNQTTAWTNWYNTQQVNCFYAP